MLKCKWECHFISTNKQAGDMVRQFRKLKPKYGAVDTETTGLHILLDKPFVIQFGYLHPTELVGYAYAVDLEKQPLLANQVIKAWLTLATELDILFGHHILFDLHMLANIGYTYSKENVSDTQFYIRYAHDTLPINEGGPPLGLKDYVARYIDGDARTHEKMLSSERTAIAKELNVKLKQMLQSCTPPPEYNARSYTLGVVDDMFKDPVFSEEDLPTDVLHKYREWRTNVVPEVIRHKVQGLVSSDSIPYNMLSRFNLIKYALMDIAYTLEVFLHTKDVLEARDNMYGVRIENQLIMPLFEMERVGFRVDKDYLEESRIRLKDYIQQRRERLYDLAGQELSIGQHALILKLLQNKFDVMATTTNADDLDRIKAELGEHPAVEFIDIIQELRTLEKWYSTYIIRFQSDLTYCDRLYTQIHQVGAVSGRVTSDFQQFPKEGIKTADGQELFHPRKMVVPTGGEYDGLVYLDYSQIELRFQAFYTILVGAADLNLCRAYMPYRCCDRDLRPFDHTDYKDIQNWNREWYLQEDTSSKWTPTDVHGKTTEEATGLSPEHPDFKRLRTVIGKRVNFAKNYGAQLPRIRQMFPDKSMEEVRKIDAAYYKAFPGVKAYHHYCYDRANIHSYTCNLFGVKYYGVSGHKLINMLIQGSAAYFLKLKIRELYDYSKLVNSKSRFQMQIHDELSWEKHYSDSEFFYECQRIMQEWPDTFVPIVAEMEVSRTNWAEKEGVHTKDEFHNYFSNRSVG